MHNLIDWDHLINFQEDNEDDWQPKATIPFFLDTPYLKREFPLDIVVWNLTEDTLDITKKVVEYVLSNFNKLFETAWTGLYYFCCAYMDDEVINNHSLTEFYQEQIDFENPYYKICVEINSDYLADGIARYHFVVATTCEYDKWMVSDDNLRVFMVDNKGQGTDTNNDDTQILEGIEYAFREDAKPAFDKVYEKLRQEGFQFAEPFQK